MSVFLLAAGAITALLIALAVRRRDRLKDSHNPAIRKVVDAIAVLSVVSVLLYLGSQFYANGQAGTMRKAQLQHNVLQDLLKFQNELLLNHATLIKHSATIYNYSEYERAISPLTDAGLAIPSWETLAGEIHRSELQESKAAFDRLQKIALEVIFQTVASPNLVPLPLSDWATKTLTIKFLDLPQYTNAYRVTPEVLAYAELTGRAIGAVIGGAYVTATTLSK